MSNGDPFPLFPFATHPPGVPSARPKASFAPQVVVLGTQQDGTGKGKT